MDPHEQLAVAHLAPLKDAKANLVRICHAVRMYRLGKLFQKFDPVTPGGKGGNQPKYDDIAIVAKARAILNSNGGNKAAASREAMERFPDLVQGAGTHESIAKRISRRL